MQLNQLFDVEGTVCMQKTQSTTGTYVRWNSQNRTIHIFGNEEQVNAAVKSLLDFCHRPVVLQNTVIIKINNAIPLKKLVYLQRSGMLTDTNFLEGKKANNKPNASRKKDKNAPFVVKIDSRHQQVTVVSFFVCFWFCFYH